MFLVVFFHFISTLSHGYRWDAQCLTTKRENCRWEQWFLCRGETRKLCQITSETGHSTVSRVTATIISRHVHNRRPAAAPLNSNYSSSFYVDLRAPLFSVATHVRLTTLGAFLSCLAHFQNYACWLIITQAYIISKREWGLLENVYNQGQNINR